MAEYHCTLAKKYNPDKHDVIGWGCSEKLDGVRAIWCPNRRGFFSRSNKPLNVPERWLTMFETIEVRLDGEFFMGRGQFQKCVSAVRKKAPTNEQFEGVQYVVFDCITEGNHQDRMAMAIASLIDSGLDITGKGIVYPLKHYTVTDMESVQAMYRGILDNGGEGLMFRNQAAGYEMKRTGNLLKWKDEIDGTALVTGFDPGKGKHEGRVGALICVCDETGVTFRVGTGLSDEERERWMDAFRDHEDPLRIRWRAMERTRDNVPRHPAYYGFYTGE